MAEVGWFGVAVSVAPAVLPAVGAPRGARLSDMLRPAGMCDAGLVGELYALGDARSKFVAYEAVVVAQLAARRPAQSELTAGQPGHRVEGWVPDRVPVGVSEFFADELALVRGISVAAAVSLAERSLVLVHQLPATWGALADGLIDEARGNAIVRALGGQSVEAGGVVEPAIVAEVEAQAVEWALAGETPVRLRDRVAAALIALDEAAADRRRRKAERYADVTVRALPDGMAELAATLPGPVAAACRETVDSYARMAKAEGDARPIGQLRAEVMADLILRPWDTSRPPVTAHLQVLAPLPVLHDRRAEGDRTVPTAEDAASVGGAPITAGQLRELLGQLDALCPGGLQAPTSGTMNIELVDPTTGALRATVTRPELERLARRGCPAHQRPPDRRPRPGSAGDECGDGRGDADWRGDADARGDADGCGCGVLDRPPPIDRYTPTPAQRRYVRARDRTCRHPGCRRPAARTDLDHVTAHRDGGDTDCANLCCLCRRHHRLKTHAPGWQFTMTPDGTLSVTTPSGVTRTTRPPGARQLAEIRRSLEAALVAADDPPPF